MVDFPTGESIFKAPVAENGRELVADPWKFGDDRLTESGALGTHCCDTGPVTQVCPATCPFGFGKTVVIVTELVKVALNVTEALIQINHAIVVRFLERIICFFFLGREEVNLRGSACLAAYATTVTARCFRTFRMLRGDSRRQSEIRQSICYWRSGKP